jgi:hypothetical protein
MWWRHVLARVDEQSAAQFGQLFAQSQANDWQWREDATYRAFWKWVAAFNDRNRR